MTSPLGTGDNPLRVAIIGSGPSAFYAVEYLQKQDGYVVLVDMYERLPTPYGLVRGGVAPDHPKIKTVTKIYDKIAAQPGFRFFGNVEFGKDILHADLAARYHQIVYAVGAQTDRRMGIPGEDLSGSYAATEFVGWYNAHPDYRDHTFDLTRTAAAIVGNGNVAMDVARILASSPAELGVTDMADHALAALTQSAVTDIYVLGRRGPAQSAFTNPELRELGELGDAEVIIDEAEAELDPLSAEYMLSSDDRMADRNVQTLMRYSAQERGQKRKRIHMRFLVSPTRLIGTERVEAIELVHNELYLADDGTLRPRATDKTEILPVGLVFRSIGYMGVPLPDVPFDTRKGVIPNVSGRVTTTDGGIVSGEYVVGWIKRGPSGIIGTNKPDSQQTAQAMIADAAEGQTLTPTGVSDAADLLRERGVEVVTFQDWTLLDIAEQSRGQMQNRPRAKFATVPEMLNAIRERRGS